MKLFTWADHQKDLAQRGLPLRPLVEIELVEGMKEMVRQGIGVTLTLPALIRPSQIGNDLVLIPISDLRKSLFLLLFIVVLELFHVLLENLLTPSRNKLHLLRYNRKTDP